MAWVVPAGMMAYQAGKSMEDANNAQTPGAVQAPVVDPFHAAGMLAAQGDDAGLRAAMSQRPVTGIDYGQTSGAMAQQQQTIDAMRGILSGLPTAATGLYQRNAFNSGQAAQALAASARGGGYSQASALRGGADQAAMMGQNSAAGMAGLLAQQQMGALGLYGAQAGQMRGDAVADMNANNDVILKEITMNNANNAFYSGIANADNVGSTTMAANTDQANQDRWVTNQAQYGARKVAADGVNAGRQANVQGAAIGAGAAGAGAVAGQFGSGAGSAGATASSGLAGAASGGADAAASYNPGLAGQVVGVAPTGPGVSAADYRKYRIYG